MSRDLTLIVIAKAPVAGRSKTRLCPPCTLHEAARLAAAALADTLTAVAAAPAARRVLALDGEPGAWIPGGFDVIAQPAGGLDSRLQAAFDAVEGPALLVGMDTPQVTPALIDDCGRALLKPGVQATLGLAPDGGYWAIGLRGDCAGIFEGVPMSTTWTGAVQRQRLEQRGLGPVMLPELRDVDTFEAALAVASECANSRFAATVAEVRIACEERAAMPVAWRAEA